MITLAVCPLAPLLQLMLELATSTVSNTNTRKKSHFSFFFPILILAETETVVLERVFSVVPKNNGNNGKCECIMRIEIGGIDNYQVHR